MLSIPHRVLQPFPLRFRRDDLVVMACFEGHPNYEAVEAMIQLRADGGHCIRAIITRHDQSQIDHVNDDALPPITARNGGIASSSPSDRPEIAGKFVSSGGGQ